jgi:hypothetical protein
MRMGVSSLRYVAATCCAVVEGVVVESQRIEMVTWSHSVV